MADYKIKITQRAYSDIFECVLFVNNVSKEAANELHKEIMNSIKSLSSFPDKYPEIDKLRIRDSRVRKMPIHKGRYIILYKVENDNVIIYDIFDTRKDIYLLKL